MILALQVSSSSGNLRKLFGTCLNKGPDVFLNLGFDFQIFLDISNMYWYLIWRAEALPPETAGDSDYFS